VNGRKVLETLDIARAIERAEATGGKLLRIPSTR
jgi:hypothetical protein